MATKFQQLSQLFKNVNSYSTDKFVSIPNQSVIAQANNRQEFEEIKRQKQQLKYLKSVWHNVKYVNQSNQLVHEAQRIPAYYDYDLMSYHEIIGRALEIYTEEVVTKGTNGTILNISSQSRSVENELIKLFRNVLNVDINLYSWVYQTIKNGDCFLHLDLDDDAGVVNARQLPVSEIERIENDYVGSLLNSHNKIDDTIFRWRGNNIIDFKYWTVAHFRLLLDDRKAPYGVSLLEKCRRLWRNLLLAEDSMLSMQLIRGVDRLVFKIDIGNIDPDDEEAYIQSIANRFKRTIKVDPATGQLDLKSQIAAIDQDYFIPKRGANDTSTIDQLQGKASMDTTVVDYFTKKLVATLGFASLDQIIDSNKSEGKTLSMQDITLARTVSRIQQHILTELNKIAIIHLVLVGMENEIDNFQLSFNNPSTQMEIMNLDLLSSKINLYKEATDPANGIAAFSVTYAKRHILGMSDEAILEDLKQQRIERAAMGELEITNQVIPKSGIFDDIDKIYGNPDAQVDFTQAGAEGGGEMGGSPFGGGGGGIGGGLGDLGGDLGGGGEETPDLGGELGAEAGAELPAELQGGAETGGEETEPTGNVEEAIRKYLNSVNKLLND